MKVLSPVIKAPIEPVFVKNNFPDIEIIGYLRFTYPIPPNCNKVDIKPLWDSHYRLNYYGNKKMLKKNGQITDWNVILLSMMVAVRKNGSGFISEVLSEE